MSRTEIKIGGMGGQGVILSGYILGRAASIFSDKHATMIQAFGPEARGSACSSQIIIDKDLIDYPYIIAPNIMVILSQEAYNKFVPELADGGILITDEELVNPTSLRKDIKHFSIPATRIAEDLGKKMVINIVIMGFFTSITKLLDVESMRQAVLASVPKGTEELNVKAFNAGFEYGENILNEKLQGTLA
ncbi:MAG: pyruvate ferredoxin oxidoreductase [Ignavibacteria bacterium]|nr:pyruvate ferredoxin oxidoreductase [Ignavibacteria bacterium]